jgi:hypothetical protein
MTNSGGEDEDWGEGSSDEEEIEEGCPRGTRRTQLGHTMMERSLIVTRTN